MGDDGKKSLRHHMVAAARDILVVCAVISLLGTTLSLITKPYWEPFADLPRAVAETQKQIATMQVSMQDSLKPRVVEFQGSPHLIGPKIVKPGESITILYSLKRNTTCETKVQVVFYDVNRGISIETGVFKATKAPVTRIYINFKLDIEIPDKLQGGSYSYTPKLTPINCGVYDTSVEVPPSEIFKVVK